MLSKSADCRYVAVLVLVGGTEVIVSNHISNRLVRVSFFKLSCRCCFPLRKNIKNNSIEIFLMFCKL